MNIYCSECGGDKDLGCDCLSLMKQKEGRDPATEETIRLAQIQHKLDAETDDEYDVDKDW